MNALHFHTFTVLEALLIGGGLILTGAIIGIFLVSLLVSSKRRAEREETLGYKMPNMPRSIPAPTTKLGKEIAKQRRVRAANRDPRASRGYPGRVTSND